MGLPLADHLQKQMSTPAYDMAIVGGGLGGLSLSILLSQAGFRIALLEKETYPFHKVCGEYISNESRPFLQGLGVDLQALGASDIERLMISSVNGRSVQTKLPLGGFGISRFVLDRELARIARLNGVDVFEATRVNDIHYDGQKFTLSCVEEKASLILTAKACSASYGKRSHLDLKWKRAFLEKQDKKLDNYLGVKYHVQTKWDEDLIGLHNFEGGYCGISRIEDDKYCLCYMTRAEDLKRAGGDLKDFETKVLSVNPFLEKIFEEGHFLPGFPVTIAQINFRKRSQVENHVIMLGDAAGLITPLCGNGMSMALHSAKLAFVHMTSFLVGDITYSTAQEKYSAQWRSAFSTRMATGRVLQSFFGSSSTSNGFVQLLNTLPFLMQPLISLTHGKPF